MIKTILKLILLIYFINSAACSKKVQSGFKDDIGNIVPVSHPVKRIISLAPNISEIMFFLNKGNLLKGVTKLCNYPRSVRKINKAGGMLNPDMDVLTPWKNMGGVLQAAQRIVSAVQNSERILIHGDFDADEKKVAAQPL